MMSNGRKHGQKAMANTATGRKWVKTVASIKDLLSSMDCPLCSSTLNKPAAVGRCSHMYCYDCIIKLCEVSSESLCPDCKEPFWLKDIHIDHNIEQIISLCQTWLPRFAADSDHPHNLVNHSETGLQDQSSEQSATLGSNIDKCCNNSSPDKITSKRPSCISDKASDLNQLSQPHESVDQDNQKSEDNMMHDECVPLYHTPPDGDRDSYVTASNKSPAPSIVSVYEDSSCQTIDLAQSSDAVNDNSKNLQSIFEISDDDLPDICLDMDASTSSPIKVTKSIKNELLVSEEKHNPADIIVKPSVPITPHEVVSQKSQHVRPVERTYIRRRKRKCAQPSTANDDDAEVTNWLENSMIFNIPEESPRSKKQRQSLPDKTLRATKVAKDTTKSIIRTRSKSSTSSVQSIEVLKTPVLKRERSSSTSNVTPLTNRKTTPNFNNLTPQSKIGSQRKPPKTPSSTPRNKRNQKGETPLHSAAITGNLEKLRFLLEEGESPDVCDNAGWTPLHEACIHRKVECAKLLIEFGAPVNSKAENHDVPLHDACAKNSVDIVKLLLDNGACKTVRNLIGLTPVDFAGSDEILELLEDATDIKNLSILNEDGDIEADIKDPVIVFSGLTSADIANFQKMDNMSFKTVEDISEQVTHLICGVDENRASKRTIKFLKAMAMGAAIVQKSWLDQSAATSEWADVSNHFVNGAVGFDETAPAISYSHHKTGVPGLFTGLTFYLDKKLDCKPSRETICQLIESVNGKMLNREPRNSVVSRTKVYHAAEGSVLHSCPTIIISDTSKALNFIVKSHSWILDCITNYKIVS